MNFYTRQIIGTSREFRREQESDSSDEEDILAFINYITRPRQERVYRNRSNHFLKWDETEFFNRFRLSKIVVNYLLNRIQQDIQSLTDRNHAVTTEQKLLLTLRFLATNDFLISVGDFIGIHKVTAGIYIYHVLKAIVKLKQEFVKMPCNENQISEHKQAFFKIARLPNVIGALDCTHVKIESPGGDQAETFRNRKGFFSFNVQAVCNADLIFLDIVARWPGSVHDSRIFNNSRLKSRFESREFSGCILVADSGYAMSDFCLLPLESTTSSAENLYNESQIRTQNVIERAFGVLKRRFPVLSLGIRLSLEKVQAIVVATVILHNLAIIFNDNLELEVTEAEEQAILETDIPTLPTTQVSLNNRHASVMPYISYFEELLS